MTNELDNFLTLCNLWCEQQLSVEQSTQLQSRLRSNHELQLVFLEFIQLHGQLVWDAGGVVGSEIAGTADDTGFADTTGCETAAVTRRRMARFSPRLVPIAAVCLVLAAIAMIDWQSLNSQQQAGERTETVDSGESNADDRLTRQPAIAVRQDATLNPDTTRLKPLILNGLNPEGVSPGIANDDPESQNPGETIATKGATHTVASDDASIIAEIDRLIAEAWTDNGIIPADVADDHEWVRRCYLTLTGRIPAVSEASAFLTSTSPRMRAELVDSLLNDQGFAENLAVTWTNLLIGRSNPRNVDEKSLWGFLLRQFRENRSWMETVGDLIAAQGRSDENGATNFLLAHLNDQATPATAVTARLFLGQQVQCTQCHDHPFAKDRRQDEFWSLNAFFKQAERRSLTVTDADGKARNVWTLTDSSVPGVTFYDTLRGQQKAVLPEFDGHAMSADNSKSRRAELVRLLAADSRKMVAQAMINRTWAFVFGYGFTNPVDDLGPHNPVSHPELVEFLTQSFSESDYNIRRLMRWFTLSRAFQLSSVQAELSFAFDDPQDGGTPLFSRMYPRPMGPEQVYDSIRIAIRSAAEKPIDSSIGSMHRREWVEQFVRSYGTDENDEQLAFEGNIAQAMLMMNGKDLQVAIPRTAAEVTKSIHLGPQNVTKLLERIAMATLNREPSEREEQIFRGRFRTLSHSVSADQAIQTATEDMLWAYLNSSEFTSLH